MARTLNGKRTGRAASIEKAELQEQIFKSWEANLPEDAVYWRNGAIAALKNLAEKVGHAEADRLTGDWDDGRSWKEICKQAEGLYWDIEFGDLEINDRGTYRQGLK